MQYLRVTVCPRWWLWAYVHGVMATAYLTGMEPDMEKVKGTLAKSIRVKVEPVSYRLVA